MTTYDRGQLVTLFPQLEWHRSAVLRCTRETSGEGKWVKAHEGHRRYGHVRIRCSPAFALSITLEHRWPDEVSADEGSTLDRALLAGLVDELSCGEHPAWHCHVRSVAVSYLPDDTDEQAVKIAAHLAVRDALHKSTWKLLTHPRGSSIHGEEPA